MTVRARLQVDWLGEPTAVPTVSLNVAPDDGVDEHCSFHLINKITLYKQPEFN